MTRRCVIERWVQRKTDQKLIFNGNYTQIVFLFSGYTFTMFYLIYLVYFPGGGGHSNVKGGIMLVQKFT